MPPGSKECLEMQAQRPNGHCAFLFHRALGSQLPSQFAGRVRKNRFEPLIALV
jgi:hypothetical protein